MGVIITVGVIILRYSGPAQLNLKIVKKSEPVGYESSNFQDFHISIVSNFGENFNKI